MCTMMYEKVHEIIIWNSENLELIEMFIVKRKLKLWYSHTMEWYAVDKRT